MATLRVVAIVAVLLACSGAARAPPFRCLRPFGALSAFEAQSMQAKDNCDFGFMRVTDARAEVVCNAGAANDTESGCFATVSFSAVTPKAVSPEFKMDNARFSFSMGVGKNTVNYKGFDGAGYSVCCSMLEGAACEWLPRSADDPRTRLAATACPLHTPATAVRGSVRKPLHRIDAGKWDAVIAFHRNPDMDHDSVVGKLLVPFTVTEAMIADALAATSTAAAAAPADSDLAGGGAVVTVKKENTEEDL
jgi:hypothetical protein